MSKKKNTSRYSVHPGVVMVQKWIAELPAKTGKSFEQWLAFIEKEGPADEAARRDWLKAEHGMGTNSAWWLAERSVGKGEEDSDPDLYLQAAERYVDAMFEGKRAGLRPIYEALLELGLGMAPDVKACPCQTIVPFYRNHVFAQIKPATNTRVDLGFALKDTPFTKRLLDTGGLKKKDRITHRIAITALSDIDNEVKRWLRKAYDMDT
ncbi:MAG: DUF5655 domain-containing protein [Gemmataceae bacterium]